MLLGYFQALQSKAIASSNGLFSIIKRRIMTRKFLAAVCMSVLSLSAHAVDMYRWIDGNGKTNISDAVPEKYKKSAQRIDSRRFELSDAQQREAAARTPLTKVTPSPALQPTSGPDNRSVSLGGQSPPPPSSNASSSADCVTLREQYRKSQDCFGPYRNANGSIKPEASTHCTVVTDPNSKCGPIITQRY